jgi:flagellar hook assembly protein FlgD
VDLVIFNSKGQKIKTLFAEKMHSGNHSIIWKGKDENNMQVASGIYFYKLTIGNQTITKKLILLK